MPTGIETTRRFATPIGVVEAVATPKGLRRVRFLRPDERDSRDESEALEGPATAQAHLARFAECLPAFLAGTARAFRGVKLDLPPMTPFRREIYKQLRRIGPGRTVSYGELAELAGRPGAARAVGSAMSQNPVALVQPCHRVLAAGGRIGGFSPSVSIKRRLLELEGAYELS